MRQESAAAIGEMGSRRRVCCYSLRVRFGRNSERARGDGVQRRSARCDRCQSRSPLSSRVARRRSRRQAPRGNRVRAALLLRQDPNQTGRPRSRRRCPRRWPELWTDSRQADRAHPYPREDRARAAPNWVEHTRDATGGADGCLVVGGDGYGPARGAEGIAQFAGEQFERGKGGRGPNLVEQGDETGDQVVGRSPP